MHGFFYCLNIETHIFCRSHVLATNSFWVYRSHLSFANWQTKVLKTRISTVPISDVVLSLPLQNNSGKTQNWLSLHERHNTPDWKLMNCRQWLLWLPFGMTARRWAGSSNGPDRHIRFQLIVLSWSAFSIIFWPANKTPPLLKVNVKMLTQPLSIKTSMDKFDRTRMPTRLVTG